MKFLKNTATYLLCAIILCAPMTSCKGPMPKQQGSALKIEINNQMRDGSISPELGRLLIAEIARRTDPNYSGGIDWEVVLASTGGILIAALSAYTGVRLKRGPAKPMNKSNAKILKELIAQAKAKMEAESKPTT